MRNARGTAAVLLSAALSVAIAACGTSKSAGPGPTSAAAITIKTFSFHPDPLPAKVGDTITVTNQDGTNHTVTANDKSFDTGPFSTGTKTITVTKAGTIAYHCNIHDYMHGTIQVSG